MAVAIDAAGPVRAFVSGGTGTTIITGVTVTSGSNVLVVTSATNDSLVADRTISAIAWDPGGVNETSFTRRAFQDIVNTNRRCEIWTLMNPTAGASKTVAITYNAASSLNRGIACAVAFSGVDGTTPIDATSELTGEGLGSNTPNLSITTVTDGAMVVDVMNHADNGNPTASLTELYGDFMDLSVSDSCGSQYTLKASAGSQACNWSGAFMTTDDWIQCAIALREDGATPPTGSAKAVHKITKGSNLGMKLGIWK